MFSIITMKYIIKRLLNQHDKDCQKKIRDTYNNDLNKDFSINKTICAGYVISDIIVILGIIFSTNPEIENHRIAGAIFLGIGVTAIVFIIFFDITTYSTHKQDFQKIKNDIRNAECQCCTQELLEHNLDIDTRTT